MALKKILLSGVAAAALSTAAFAAPSATTNVALDQTGDYLVFPTYAASGDWKTNIKVVNTNTTTAVVAKVVIREAKNSAEVIDFPIYLSPGDVWEGEVVANGTGAKITSSDDSVYHEINAKWGSEQTFDVSLANKSGSEQYGYVEVFGLAAKPGYTANVAVSKADIRADFLANVHAIDDAGATAMAAGWTAVDTDSLHGQEIVYSTGRAMSLMATAFEGVTGSVPMDKDTIGRDSTLSNTTIRDAGDATDVDELLVNIENALDKNNIYVIHDLADGSSANLILTQPMKKYRNIQGLALQDIGYEDETTATELSHYYFTYNKVIRNQSENAQFDTIKDDGISGNDNLALPTYKANYESHWVNVDTLRNYTTVLGETSTTTAGHSKGYIDMNIDAGIPMIPVYMQAVNNGSTTRSLNLTYQIGRAHV